MRCTALIALANVDFKQARAVEARAFLSEAQSLASELGDRLLQIRAGFESANLRAWFEGEDQGAVDEFRRTLAIAEELESRPLRIEGHMRLGVLLFNLGRLADAERDLLRCAALADDVGSFRDEARVTYQLSMVKYYRGEPAEAERLALQADEWLDRTGDTFFRVQNLRALAIYALTKGDARAAEERLREAVPLALGSETLVLEVYRLLTDALLEQRRLDEARQLAEFAARNVPEEDLYGRTAVLLAEASVATAEGDQPEAERAFAEALDLLEQQHLLLDLGEALIAFGRALRSFGAQSRARDELERARSLLARMGALGLVDAADRELAQIERGAGDAGPLSRPRASLDSRCGRRNVRGDVDRGDAVAHQACSQVQVVQAGGQELGHVEGLDVPQGLKGPAGNRVPWKIAPAGTSSPPFRTSASSPKGWPSETMKSRLALPPG